jgi:hypothetical protein
VGASRQAHPVGLSQVSQTRHMIVPSRTFRAHKSCAQTPRQSRFLLPSRNGIFRFTERTSAKRAFFGDRLLGLIQINGRIRQNCLSCVLNSGWLAVGAHPMHTKRSDRSRLAGCQVRPSGLFLPAAATRIRGKRNGRLRSRCRRSHGGVRVRFHDSGRSRQFGQTGNHANEGAVDQPSPARSFGSGQPSFVLRPTGTLCREKPPSRATIPRSLVGKSGMRRGGNPQTLAMFDRASIAGGRHAGAQS